MYNFYFDESSHHYNVSPKNLTTDDSFLDSYIGFFWGVSDGSKEYNSIVGKYQTIESYYKIQFSAGNELKGTKIRNIKDLEKRKYHSSNETFRYGVASFDDTVADFYNSYFSIFDDEIIIQLVCLSKFEQILKSLISKEQVNKKVKMQAKLFKQYYSIDIPSSIDAQCDAAYYSLIKLFYTYKSKEFMDMLYNNEIENEKKIEYIKHRLSQIKDMGIDLVRKQREVPIIEFFLSILDEDMVSNRIKKSFSHDYVANGFDALLRQTKIKSKDVRLYPDKSHEINFETLNLYSVSETDSKHSIGVRIADIFSGFIYKILLANTIERRDNFEEHTTKEDFAKLSIISEEWFNLNEKQFNLYLKLSAIFFKRNNISWTTNVGLYTDETILFSTLIEYFRQFENFEEYNKFSSTSHEKKFHKFEMEYLEGIFNQRGWNI